MCEEPLSDWFEFVDLDLVRNGKEFRKEAIYESKESKRAKTRKDGYS